MTTDAGPTTRRLLSRTAGRSSIVPATPVDDAVRVPPRDGEAVGKGTSAPGENTVDITSEPVPVVTMALRSDVERDVAQPEKADGGRGRHATQPRVQLPGGNMGNLCQPVV